MTLLTKQTQTQKMKKLITALLTFSALAVTALPASARTIWSQGRTNDGLLLGIDLRQHFNRDRGWTVFNYMIMSRDGSIGHRSAITPYCLQGRVQLNPRATQLVTLPKQGWIAVNNGNYVIVTADSAASKQLLKTVCQMAN
jgi:hypothetical protein